jgi:hypothetical protein
MEVIDMKYDAIKWIFSDEINNSSISRNGGEIEEKLKVDRKKFEALLNGNGLYDSNFENTLKNFVKFDSLSN